MGNNPEQGQQIHTIMVVDDDDTWCFVAKKLLKRERVGREILTANNGQEALEKLQAISANGEKLPELIFLDLKMPVMDGFEFLNQVTKWEGQDFGHTRIFICSSSFNAKDKQKAKQYPVSGYITKPLTPEVLRDIIQVRS